MVKREPLEELQRAKQFDELIVVDNSRDSAEPTYERIERAREDERLPLNRKARETLAWVLANRVMHDEDEL